MNKLHLNLFISFIFFLCASQMLTASSKRVCVEGTNGTQVHRPPAQPRAKSLDDVMYQVPNVFLTFLEADDLRKLPDVSKTCRDLLIASERSALLTFNKVGWGVKLKLNVNGTVEKLYLESRTDNVSIPPCIAAFTQLKELVIRKGRYITEEGISFYEITGSLPREIGLLKNLEELDAKGAGITSFLPESMKLMENLRLLNLKGNHILGSIPASFFEGERGPLRSEDSYIRIWWETYITVNFGEEEFPMLTDAHSGSILNMAPELRVTPNLNDLEMRPPVMRRSNAIAWIKTWWGGEFS